MGGSITVVCLCLHIPRTEESYRQIRSECQQLYMEKASKEDMREFENRVARQVEGIKSDILSRLDFYFSAPKQKATNK